MLGLRFTSLLLLSASSVAHAAGCDAIRAQIETKIRGSGVTSFALSVVEADAKASGKVVGTCELGTKKIVYTTSATTTARPPSRQTEERILTECKDGSVSMGGDCKKP